jgi:hypothetical protein
MSLPGSLDRLLTQNESQTWRELAAAVQLRQTEVVTRETRAE